MFCAKSPHVEDLKRSPERTFRIGEHMLTMKQRWLPGGDGGTALKHGASVYDAAFVLGDYLHRGPVKLNDKRVVELGTGPGLGAIAAALCNNVQEVIATDGDAQLLTLTQENFDLNMNSINTTNNDTPDVRSRCRCEVLLWGNEPQAVALKPPFDVILAADCAAVVYENAFRDLISTLSILSDENSLILLSYHRRHHSEYNFFDMLSETFTYQEVNNEHIHPDFRSCDITIFEIRQKKKRGGGGINSSTTPTSPERLC